MHEEHHRTADHPRGVAEHAQQFLGIDRVLNHLHRLENLMATATEQLNQLNAKVDDIAADVQVLATKSGQLDAEGQAALDRLTGKLSDLDVQVGDQDGSDTPASPGEQPNA